MKFHYALYALLGIANALPSQHMPILEDDTAGVSGRLSSADPASPPPSPSHAEYAHVARPAKACVRKPHHKGDKPKTPSNAPHGYHGSPAKGRPSGNQPHPAPGYDEPKHHSATRPQPVQSVRSNSSSSPRGASSTSCTKSRTVPNSVLQTETFILHSSHSSDVALSSTPSFTESTSSRTCTTSAIRSSSSSSAYVASSISSNLPSSYLASVLQGSSIIFNTTLSSSSTGSVITPSSSPSASVSSTTSNGVDSSGLSESALSSTSSVVISSTEIETSSSFSIAPTSTTSAASTSEFVSTSSQYMSDISTSSTPGTDSSSSPVETPTASSSTVSTNTLGPTSTGLPTPSSSLTDSSSASPTASGTAADSSSVSATPDPATTSSVSVISSSSITWVYSPACTAPPANNLFPNGDFESSDMSSWVGEVVTANTLMPNSSLEAPGCNSNGGLAINFPTGIFVSGYQYSLHSTIPLVPGTLYTLALNIRIDNVRYCTVRAWNKPNYYPSSILMSLGYQAETVSQANWTYHTASFIADDYALTHPMTLNFTCKASFPSSLPGGPLIHLDNLALTASDVSYTVDSPPAAGANIVNDPTFSSGSLSQWTIQASSNSAITLVTISDGVYAARLAVAPSSNAYGIAVLQQFLPTKKGVPYRVTVTYKLDADFQDSNGDVSTSQTIQIGFSQLASSGLTLAQMYAVVIEGPAVSGDQAKGGQWMTATGVVAALSDNDQLNLNFIINWGYMANAVEFSEIRVEPLA